MTFRLLAQRVREHLHNHQIQAAIHLLDHMLVNHPTEREHLPYRDLLKRIATGQVPWEPTEIEALLLDIVREVEREEIKRTRLYLHYEGPHDGPGSSFARSLQRSLRSHQFPVFSTLENWSATPHQRNAELERTHYLLLLLPPRPKISPTLQQVLQSANRGFRTKGRPQIIPIRLAWPVTTRPPAALRSLFRDHHPLDWQAPLHTPPTVDRILDLLYLRQPLSPTTSPTIELPPPPKTSASQRPWLGPWSLLLLPPLVLGCCLLFFDQSVGAAAPLSPPPNERAKGELVRWLTTDDPTALGNFLPLADTLVLFVNRVAIQEDCGSMDQRLRELKRTTAGLRVDALRWEHQRIVHIQLLTEE